MECPLSVLPQTTPVLVIESDTGVAHTLHDLLFGYLGTTLDLALARSLRDGMTYLCTHEVPVILMGLALSDYKGLDAVRALRLTAPESGVIAYGSTVNEKLRLDAIRAGAHEVLSLADTSADTFRLAVECAVIRATLPAMKAVSSPPDRPLTDSTVAPKLVHDLNNAITSVNGFADILLARSPADDTAQVCAEQIKRAGTRAALLVSALTPSSQSSAGSASNPAGTAQAA